MATGFIKGHDARVVLYAVRVREIDGTTGMILKPAGDNTSLVGMYVGEAAGVLFTPGMYQAFAVINDSGEFCAGVVISEFRGYDCQLSCASETPMAWIEEVVGGVFEYVYHQLGCVRCTAMTKKSNKRCRAFLEHLGFTLEGRVRLGYDGIKDALIYGLLASECRYLEENKDGQVHADDADSAEPDAGGGPTAAVQSADSPSERGVQPRQSIWPDGFIDV